MARGSTTLAQTPTTDATRAVSDTVAFSEDDLLKSLSQEPYREEDESRPSIRELTLQKDAVPPTEPQVEGAKAEEAPAPPAESKGAEAPGLSQGFLSQEDLNALLGDDAGLSLDDAGGSGDGDVKA
jgi:hypothetical protein